MRTEICSLGHFAPESMSRRPGDDLRWTTVTETRQVGGSRSAALRSYHARALRLVFRDALANYQTPIQCIASPSPPVLLRAHRPGRSLASRTLVEVRPARPRNHVLDGAGLDQRSIPLRAVDTLDPISGRWLPVLGLVASPSFFLNHSRMAARSYIGRPRHRSRGGQGVARDRQMNSGSRWRWQLLLALLLRLAASASGVGVAGALLRWFGHGRVVGLLGLAPAGFMFAARSGARRPRVSVQRDSDM